MKNLVTRVGPAFATIVMTVAAVVASVGITFFILDTFGNGVEPLVLMVAIVAPMTIAPVIGGMLIKLIYQINQLEEEQRYLACSDELTGLRSRRAFLENFELLREQAKRDGSILSVAIIDIDNFKSINDTYGHGGVDALLKSFAGILKKNLRKSDLVGRIGGEEFAMVFLHHDPEKAMKALEKVRIHTQKNVVDYLKQKIKCTISVGVVQWCSHELADVEVLMRQADESLYHAKKTGKNRVIKFDPSLKALQA